LRSWCPRAGKEEKRGSKSKRKKSMKMKRSHFTNNLFWNIEMILDLISSWIERREEEEMKDDCNRTIFNRKEKEKKKKEKEKGNSFFD